jgi:hypothetical protein
MPTKRQPPFGEISAKLADRVFHVVGVTDLYDRILGFLLLFLPSSSSVVLTKLSGLFGKSGSAGKGTRTSESVGRNSDH